ncbi:MAG: hypothetical protein ACM3XR_10395 [Bacillota bacterium]
MELNDVMRESLAKKIEAYKKNIEKCEAGLAQVPESQLETQKTAIGIMKKNCAALEKKLAEQKPKG